MKKIHLIATLFLGLAGASFADTNRNPQIIYQQIQQLMDSYTNTTIPGISLSIQLPNQPMVTLVSGVQNITSGESLKTDNYFEFGSVSKMYDAALIMKLIEKNQLALNETLHAVVAQGDVQNPGVIALQQLLNQYPFLNQITIQRLLTHTSGLKQDMFNPLYWERWRSNRFYQWTLPEIIRMSAEQELYTDGAYHYSNANFNLLALVIEALSNKTYKHNADTLLAQLKLTNTYFLPDVNLIAPHMAHAYTPYTTEQTAMDPLIATAPIFVDQPPPCLVIQQYKNVSNALIDITLASDITWIGMADGGMIGSTQDMLHWMLDLQSNQVVQAKTLQLMLGGKDHHALVTSGSHNHFNTFSGLGLDYYEMLDDSGKPNGVTLWGHSGGEIGYASEAFYLSHQQTGFSYVFTTDDFDSEDAFFLSLVKILASNQRSEP